MLHQGILPGEGASGLEDGDEEAVLGAMQEAKREVVDVRVSEEAKVAAVVSFPLEAVRPVELGSTVRLPCLLRTQSRCHVPHRLKRPQPRQQTM